VRNFAHCVLTSSDDLCMVIYMTNTATTARNYRGRAERLIWKAHRRGFLTFDMADRLVDVTCWGIK
jgi:hypothetical protein